MIEMDSSESSGFKNALRRTYDSESEPHILTRKAVDEENENFIAPSAKQLEDLTRLMQRRFRAHQMNFP